MIFAEGVAEERINPIYPPATSPIAAPVPTPVPAAPAAPVTAPSASAAAEPVRGNDKADMSYAFGIAVAEDLKQTGIKDFNYNAFIAGFRETMENQKTSMTLDEAYDIVDNAIQNAMMVLTESSRQAENEFLARNAARPGVYTTASGLQYEIITEGTGSQPSIQDMVIVHYTGILIDGTIFDSSYDYGEPVEIPLMGVIPGWSEGLQLMREGGKSRLYIPSGLAYGSQGAGGFIPPYSALIFEVELFGIYYGEEFQDGFDPR